MARSEHHSNKGRIHLRRPPAGLTFRLQKGYGLYIYSVTVVYFYSALDRGQIKYPAPVPYKLLLVDFWCREGESDCRFVLILNKLLKTLDTQNC
jgi:hypothetical protein